LNPCATGGEIAHPIPQNEKDPRANGSLFHSDKITAPARKDDYDP